jgi:hypothetical protein
MTTVEVPEKLMSLFCNACNEIFMIPSRRGRPPKYCTKCITGGDAMEYEDVRRDREWEQAQIRVDNLEMMLKSRGTHISQNKAKWE